SIIALTANPDSARSTEGDVILDEFAFHLDARKIYEAIEPSITRGFATICSIWCVNSATKTKRAYQLTLYCPGLDVFRPFRHDKRQDSLRRRNPRGHRGGGDPCGTFRGAPSS